MNFFPGEVQGGAFRFASGGSIPVDPAISTGAATLGVRPEDLIIDGDALPLGKMKLDVVEQMGHETIVHFESAGGSYVARLPADVRVQPGDQLPLAIRSQAFHLFAADDTGRRLN